MSGTLPSQPTVSVYQFRETYPEFDPNVYPDGQVTNFLIQGTYLLDPGVWGGMYGPGIMLFAAHNLALSRRNSILAASGGLLGSTGVTSSKSVGGVSVSYDNSLSRSGMAGPYNLTTYGQQLFYWMRIFGVGAVQLTGLSAPLGPGVWSTANISGGLAGGTWAGPNYNY